MMSRPCFDHRRSPNHDARVAGKSTDILLLHYTGMLSAESALGWLTDPASRVSAHYLVVEDGRIACLVDENRRAWHAGRSFWAGETNINARSIGVEIANPGHKFGYRRYPEAQIEAVIALCRDIVARHAMAPQRVLAHSDVAPLRKDDPGELFPWDRLNAGGIGHWVAPAAIADGPVLKRGDGGEAVAALKERFRQYGYGIGNQPGFDAETEAVVRAFQRHFRPARVDGVADTSTTGTLDKLLAALG